MNKQLDLFARPESSLTSVEHVASAEIIAMPGWAEREARKAASVIVLRPAQKWDWHRVDQARIFRNRLVGRNLPYDLVRREVATFTEALVVEMRRQQVLAFLFGSSEQGVA